MHFSHLFSLGVESHYHHQILGTYKSVTILEKTFQMLKLIVLLMNFTAYCWLNSGSAVSKQLVSKFVNVYAGQSAPSTENLRTAWGSEIGVHISEGTWAKCF